MGSAGLWVVRWFRLFLLNVCDRKRADSDDLSSSPCAGRGTGGTASLGSTQALQGGLTAGQQSWDS